MVNSPARKLTLGLNHCKHRHRTCRMKHMTTTNAARIEFGKTMAKPLRRWLTSIVFGLVFLSAHASVGVLADDPTPSPAVQPASTVPRVGSFRVRLDALVADAPITGRLYVFLSQRRRGQPMKGPNWFRPEPFLGVDVVALQPGSSVVVDDSADGFPDKLSKIPPGTYRVQAILDHDFYEQNHARGVGNFHSEVVEIELAADADGSVELVLNETIPARDFPESDRVREIVLPSELLSKFHHREVVQRAAIVLPESYEENSQRRYPMLYIIPGFGGSHHGAKRYLHADRPKDESPGNSDRVEFIRIVLNANCKWGHHVFADSATNGPRGQALIEELIPHIDANYRTIAAPTARFVSGHSSGGWSSLWLQISYPKLFGGVWSTAPDPVDFRDYQGVDLYAEPPLSLYFDDSGERRPIARSGTEPVLWYESFAKMDDVLGRGGQLRSFEATFSPLDDDGFPRRLWNRTSGRIDPKVARAWRRYDIRIVLERGWADLEPRLRGKLHIVTGGIDSFYLNGAVERLAETLDALGSDAQVIVVPAASHSGVLNSDAAKQMRRQMVEAFLAHHPESP